jgi:hypothetical protein
MRTKIHLARGTGDSGKITLSSVGMDKPTFDISAVLPPVFAGSKISIVR